MRALLLKSEYSKDHDVLHIHFKNSLDYIMNKFPLKSEVICNTDWVNVSERIDATWSNVEFFLKILEMLHGLKLKSSIKL